MFQLLGSLLNLLAYVVFFSIQFPLGDPVYRGSSVYVAVCHMGRFLAALPGVLLSISRKFLAHEIHPTSQIGFHLCWRCH